MIVGLDQAEVMSSRHAIVLYGSETGNAQEAAEELGRLMRRLHFSVRTCAFDEVDLESIKACTVLVCSIATTGQGEFPMNSRKFWRKLLSKFERGSSDRIELR